MKKTISKSEFCEEFVACNRAYNFSYAGREALFDYFESLEEDNGEEMELNVIAICCDFTEYDSLEEFNKVSGKIFETIDEINDKTIVIPIDDDAFIIQNY